MISKNADHENAEPVLKPKENVILEAAKKLEGKILMPRVCVGARTATNPVTPYQNATLSPFGSTGTIGKTLFFQEAYEQSILGAM